MGLTLSGVTAYLGGSRVIDALDLEVAGGELVCLLGPSGCGKTTTLRIIGGFLAPVAGRVLIDGQDRTDLPPERRPTAMVFQNYALWPHLTVYQNIAFGLRVRKVPKAEIRRRVEEMLALVDLTEVQLRRPSGISGGQQQRVALARALVLEPEVLLLDEPLSNLDAKLRVRVREDIRELQQKLGITTVFVTHDQDEALSIADRVAVMNAGRIEQYATPAEVYARPATPFVAEFVGTMNFFDGHAAGDTVSHDGVTVPCLSRCTAVDGPVRIGVRPEDVRLSEDGVPAEVVRAVPRGHFTELLLAVGEWRLRAFRTAAADIPAAGEHVGIAFRRALVYRDDRLA
jgi:ABC-type Fe3+/spermidine/putrescine transport system ATPase subunit